MTRMDRNLRWALWLDVTVAFVAAVLSLAYLIWPLRTGRWQVFVLLAALAMGGAVGAVNCLMIRGCRNVIADLRAASRHVG